MTKPIQMKELSVSQRHPAIELRNLVKRYGNHAAVDDVSLSVEAGVFVTLLGPSGCGKSTLLRSIAGFATPTSGSIVVDGRDITHELAYRRPVSMVFQDYALFPHMTVRQNIAFGCEMQGQAQVAIDERCRQMLALIHLPDVGDRYPAQLSGGQQQRVALARALAPDPVSLLLDEPLGALDLKLRRQMQRELKHIQRQTGKTFVFVTHDQEEAMSMSDRIAVMREGRIEQIGKPKEIYRNPATAFVAGFIGDANMVGARVVEAGSETLLLEVAGLRWPVPAARVTAPAMPAAGASVMIVIRPEDMRVSGRSGEEDLVLTARLKDRTFLGGRVRLDLCAEDGTALIAEARQQVFEQIAEVVELRCASSDVAIVPAASDH
ncbi:ABC transporter ATP-binding protein [Pelagibius sp.]|uniref:ABC transporter ATP-binding protein n=1 Tax=Pelagibius sp. TaxID=1931238 RepID=UPI002602B8C0|nr:ABC transporter ATP-binding protein [Pelagibius sp.]